MSNLVLCLRAVDIAQWLNTELYHAPGPKFNPQYKKQTLKQRRILELLQRPGKQSVLAHTRALATQNHKCDRQRVPQIQSFHLCLTLGKSFNSK